MARIKQIIEIPISQINVGTVPRVPHPLAFEADIQDLMDSLKKFGLLQPIVVCEAGDGKYEVLAGRRRVIAYVQMRAPHIWAAIMDERVDLETGNAIWLTENLVRRVSEEDLTAVFELLLKKYGTVKALAEQTGLPLEKVRRYAGVS
jgi:ParB family chromosome partitioning protein